MIKLFINDTQVTAEEGWTVLEAARHHGVPLGAAGRGPPATTNNTPLVPRVANENVVLSQTLGEPDESAHTKKHKQQRMIPA